MTSNLEKAFNLIFKKRFFLFLKYFYILLLVFAFLGIAIYHVLGLIRFFELDTDIQKTLFYSAIEIFIIIFLSLATGISLLFLNKKSKLFLVLYSIIPIYQLLFSIIMELLKKDIQWNNVMVYFLFFIIPSILGWFYNFIMNLLNKKIQKINGEIDTISNGSQP